MNEDIKETFLYDKVNGRSARNWFKDKEGNFYIDTDPNGVQMSGKITIISVANNPNYEVRKCNRWYIKEIKNETS